MSLAAIRKIGRNGFPEEISVDDPKMKDLRLHSLLPAQTYSISVSARTAMGAGPAYTLEDTTLPSGRKLDATCTE